MNMITLTEPLSVEAMNQLRECMSNKNVIILTDPLSVEEREFWARENAERIKETWLLKYLRGQHDHGADLGSVPLNVLLTELENEALDMLSYAAEIRRRINL